MKKCTGENCPMMDIIVKGLSGVSTMPADFREIKKWLESPWEGKP